MYTPFFTYDFFCLSFLYFSFCVRDVAYKDAKLRIYHCMQKKVMMEVTVASIANVTCWCRYWHDLAATATAAVAMSIAYRFASNAINSRWCSVETRLNCNFICLQWTHQMRKKHINFLASPDVCNVHHTPMCCDVI